MNYKYTLILSAIAIPFAASADVIDFNLSGFTTQYADRTSGTLNMYAEGTYAIVAGGVAPSSHHGSWTGASLTNPDASTPSYMLVNAFANNGLGGMDLWTETFTGSGNNTYFEFGATAVYTGDSTPYGMGGSAAKMQVVVTDNTTPGSYTVIDSGDVLWSNNVLQAHSIGLGTLTAGDSYSITLQDRNMLAGGNDFAVAAPVPEPAPFAALGFGAVALLRRRSKKA